MVSVFLPFYRELNLLAHFFVVGATAQWWNIGGNDKDNDVAKVDTTTTLTTLADVTDTTVVVTGTRTSTTFTTTTSGMDTTKKEWVQV